MKLVNSRLDTSKYICIINIRVGIFEQKKDRYEIIKIRNLLDRKSYL